MRLAAVLRLSAAAVLVTACDGSPSSLIAGLAGVSGATGSGIVISPSQVTLRVGGTTQLSTNLSAADAANVEWSSLQSTIAAVSPSGLVTGIAAGSTSVVARLATDTTVSGTATITVTP